jgi:hypothetical protein
MQVWDFKKNKLAKKISTNFSKYFLKYIKKKVKKRLRRIKSKDKKKWVYSYTYKKLKQQVAKQKGRVRLLRSFSPQQLLFFLTVPKELQEHEISRAKNYSLDIEQYTKFIAEWNKISSRPWRSYMYPKNMATEHSFKGFVSQVYLDLKYLSHKRRLMPAEGRVSMLRRSLRHYYRQMARFFKVYKPGLKGDKKHRFFISFAHNLNAIEYKQWLVDEVQKWLEYKGKTQPAFKKQYQPKEYEPLSYLDQSGNKRSADPSQFYQFLLLKKQKQLKIAGSIISHLLRKKRSMAVLSGYIQYKINQFKDYHDKFGTELAELEEQVIPFYWFIKSWRFEDEKYFKKNIKLHRRKYGWYTLFKTKIQRVVHKHRYVFHTIPQNRFSYVAFLIRKMQLFKRFKRKKRTPWLPPHLYRRKKWQEKMQSLTNNYLRHIREEQIWWLRKRLASYYKGTQRTVSLTKRARSKFFKNMFWFALPKIVLELLGGRITRYKMINTWRVLGKVPAYVPFGVYKFYRGVLLTQAYVEWFCMQQAWMDDVRNRESRWIRPQMSSRLRQGLYSWKGLLGFASLKFDTEYCYKYSWKNPKLFKGFFRLNVSALEKRSIWRYDMGSRVVPRVGKKRQGKFLRKYRYSLLKRRRLKRYLKKLRKFKKATKIEKLSLKRPVLKIKASKKRFLKRLLKKKKFTGLRLQLRRRKKALHEGRWSKFWWNNQYVFRLFYVTYKKKVGLQLGGRKFWSLFNGVRYWKNFKNFIKLHRKVWYYTQYMPSKFGYLQKVTAGGRYVKKQHNLVYNFNNSGYLSLLAGRPYKSPVTRMLSLCSRFKVPSFGHLTNCFVFHNYSNLLLKEVLSAGGRDTLNLIDKEGSLFRNPVEPLILSAVFYNSYLKMLVNGGELSVYNVGLARVPYLRVLLQYLKLLKQNYFYLFAEKQELSRAAYYGLTLFFKFLRIACQRKRVRLRYNLLQERWRKDFPIDRRLFVRKKKKLFTMKILLRRLLRWMYKIKKIPYFWSSTIKQTRMSTFSNIKAVLYKKNYKILV